MTYLKKIFAACIVWILLCLNMSPVVQAYVEWQWDMSTREYIRTHDWWEDILKKVDVFMNTHKKNKKLMKALHSKVTDKLAIVEANTKREKMVFSILTYIQEGTELALKSTVSNITVSQKTSKELLEEYMEELSSDDKAMLKSELIPIQKHLFKASVGGVEKALWEIENLMQYEEKGDFSAKIDVDHEMVGKVKAQLNLDDYTATASDFDTQLKTKMRAVLEAAPAGQEAMKVEFSWLIDLISKDQNFYLLLQNFDVVSEEGTEEMKELLAKAKELALKNKYLHFEDKQTAEALEILQSFSPANILAEWDIIMSESFFRGYKKINNRYYMVPTKYACDILKEYVNKFDPFNGSDCSDRQYKNLLSDMADLWIQLYIEIWSEEKTLGVYSTWMWGGVELLQWSMTFNTTSMEKMNIELLADQKTYPWEWLGFSYEAKSWIKWYLYADKWSVDMKLEWVLNHNNIIESLVMNAKAWDYFTAKMNIKDRNISWDYTYEMFWITLKGLLTGRVSKTWWISALKVWNTVINNSSNSPLSITSILDYSSGKLMVKNTYTDKSNTFSMDGDFLWAEDSYILKAFDINMDYQSKLRVYNSASGTYEYAKDFSQIFTMDVSLKDEEIKGTTAFFANNWKKLLSIDHTWEYKNEYLVFDNAITVSSDWLEASGLVYGVQIKKARDSARITDIMMLRSAIEQYYQDMAEYPSKENFASWLSQYMARTIPKDPSGNIEIDGCKFGYIYKVWPDANNIANSSYSLSTCLEYAWNRAKDDNWLDELRFEVGMPKLEAEEEFYINDYTTWEKKEWEEKSIEKLNVDVNIMYDFRGEKNNVGLEAKAMLWLKKVFGIVVKNEWTREQKETNVLAPKESEIIPLEELLDIPSY